MNYSHFQPKSFFTEWLKIYSNFFRQFNEATIDTFILIDNQ